MTEYNASRGENTSSKLNMQ